MNEPTQKQRDHFEQQMGLQWNDFHHIIPTSRGGGNNGNNKVEVNVDLHRKFHQLFSNRTPIEIIDFLIEYFWNGEISFLKDYLEGKGYEVVKKEKRLKEVSSR